MANRLSSTRTLVEGMAAVKFGDVNPERKSELEELIRVPQMQVRDMVSQFTWYIVLFDKNPLTKVKKERVEALRRKLSNTPGLVSPSQAVPGHDL